MKNGVWLLAIASMTCPAWGATLCVPGTLSTYVSLGAGGCTIGADTVSGFRIVAVSSGASAISQGNVTVAPSGTTGSPTLAFGLNLNTTQTLEMIFDYRISGATFTGSKITGSNASSTGNGTVTDVQNLCGAGSFGNDGVSVCSGTTLGPLVIASPDTQSTTFLGVSFLSVTDDFVVDGGGGGGTAQAGTFADNFTAAQASSVPEPGTISIMAIGAGLLFTGRNLRLRRSN